MFDSAVRNNPMDYKSYIFKARVFEERKQFQEAAESYRKVFELISKE